MREEFSHYVAGKAARHERMRTMKTRCQHQPAKPSLGLVAVLLVGMSASLFGATPGLAFKGKWPGHRLGPARAVPMAGNYAYVAAEGLLVIDISDPANPRLAGFYDQVGAANGVALAGHYAYMVNNTDGLQVIDVDNPANP